MAPKEGESGTLSKDKGVGRRKGNENHAGNKGPELNLPAGNQK